MQHITMASWCRTVRDPLLRSKHRKRCHHTACDASTGGCRSSSVPPSYAYAVAIAPSGRSVQNLSCRYSGLGPTRILPAHVQNPAVAGVRPCRSGVSQQVLEVYDCTVVGFLALVYLFEFRLYTAFLLGITPYKLCAAACTTCHGPSSCSVWQQFEFSETTSCRRC